MPQSQLKSCTTNHQREMLDLQCQLDAANRRIHELSSNSSNTATAVSKSSAHHQRHQQESADDSRVDVTTMIREDGEVKKVIVL